MGYFGSSIFLIMGKFLVFGHSLGMGIFWEFGHLLSMGILWSFSEYFLSLVILQ